VTRPVSAPGPAPVPDRRRPPSDHRGFWPARLPGGGAPWCFQRGALKKGGDGEDPAPEASGLGGGLALVAYGGGAASGAPPTSASPGRPACCSPTTSSPGNPAGPDGPAGSRTA